ncbi:GPP34 family phosphoprotein [Citricoccus nitrophenolicus]|uniref:Golgi phosphoprotein 3 GPP34 n=1 Tax=Citricoccus muralis TaxID=169134 RepID=A0A3D9L9G9_9MICC|nr:GPP34 family phosphoprotein [Citricoccus muralis]REE02324.1 Golgi phosphoprotein 3 GPP34 [Citricoccus muralis]
MLIVEEMYLLLTKDHGTAGRARGYRSYGLTAAALADLAELGMIEIAREGKDPQVTVVRAGMTGHASLDAVLPALDSMSGQKISTLVGRSQLNPDTAVGQSLARQGIVTEESRFLRGPHFMITSPAPEIALRERLGQVLAGDRQATLAEATELGLLKALNVAHGLLGPARGQLDRRELPRRIEEIAHGIPAVEAVKCRVDPFTASTMATVATNAG